MYLFGVHLIKITNKNKYSLINCSFILWWALQTTCQVIRLDFELINLT